MTNDEVKKLCLNLLRADSEDDVISLLREAGYWDNPEAWAFYGDTENNYGQVGNQQSRSDSALVEKIVNAVDASLIRRCHEAGVDPESAEAPSSIRAAVAMFFEGATPPISESAGRLSEWEDSRRREVAREITVAVTGNPTSKGNPCITVADAGEGQTPTRMPETLLSLAKSNKLRIPFVQGKFNMGSTGALEFCGTRNLQLIISRRCPSSPVVPGDESGELWGFTVVRRDNPQDGRRHSTYVYLAPVAGSKSSDRRGVLRFAAKALPIFPENRDAYVRTAEWGTAIKLFEYQNTGYSNTNALMKDGLMRRLDILLPEIALPVRIHECRRSFSGHEGSFANSMTGVRTRLNDDSRSNLELSPIHCPMTVMGESLRASLYAFKRGKAETYAKNEGVVFMVNGQAHGVLPRDFFRRKSVGMSYLAESLLVILDCSTLSPRNRELLFMPSRDRLRGCDLKDAIEASLADVIKSDPQLRDLKAKRREEDIEEKLIDEKPLEDVLAEMLRHSPTLSSVLLGGTRLSNPFRPNGDKGTAKAFSGKRFPTFFKFKDKNAGDELVRPVAINRRARISFETDAEDNYFERPKEPGQLALFVEVGGVRKSVSDYAGPALSSGVGTLSLQLPHNCQEGDELSYVAVIDDTSRVDPIENRFTLRVVKAAVVSGGGGSSNSSRGSKGSGEGKAPEGFSLPKVTKVFEAEWGREEFKFDKFSGLKIVAVETEGSKTTYDFFVNADNFYLKTEMKRNSGRAKLAEAKFIFGMVLIGLGLIHEDGRERKNVEGGQGDSSLEDQLQSVTRAVAPVLIPMIDELGSLDPDIDLGLEGS